MDLYAQLEINREISRLNLEIIDLKKKIRKLKKSIEKLEFELYPKKMSLEDIEKEIGYKIELIDEEKK